MHRGCIRIGEILVKQGVLSTEQVDLIVEEQELSSRPFGDLAERMFGIDPVTVQNAWLEQYLSTVGVTDLSTLYIDGFALRTISARQAWQFHVLPLYREDGILAMATDDSNVVRALNFVTRSLSEPVQLLVTTRDQLRTYLMKHYPVPKELIAYADRLTGVA